MNMHCYEPLVVSIERVPVSCFKHRIKERRHKMKSDDISGGTPLGKFRYAEKDPRVHFRHAEVSGQLEGVVGPTTNIWLLQHMSNTSYVTSAHLLGS